MFKNTIFLYALSILCVSISIHAQDSIYQKTSKEKISFSKELTPNEKIDSLRKLFIINMSQIKVLTKIKTRD